MKLPLTGNNTLREILKSFDRDMKTVPTFEQYHPDSRPNFIKEEKNKRAVKYKVKLQELLANLKWEKSKRLEGMLQLRHGDLKKETYSSTNLRQTAAIEYNSAVTLSIAKPENIDSIVSDAILQKRNEFAFSLCDLLLTQKLNNAYKYKVEQAFKQVKELTGYSKLEDEYKSFANYEDETFNHLKLLESDLEEFEKHAHNTVRTETVIEENKQYQL